MSCALFLFTEDTNRYFVVELHKDLTIDMPPETWYTFLVLIWIAHSKVVLAENTWSMVKKKTTLTSCTRNGECPHHDPAKRVAKNICSSLVTFSNPGQLFFPQDYQHLQRPWVDNPTATAATSPTVSQAIHSLLHLEVEGLDGERVNYSGTKANMGASPFPLVILFEVSSWVNQQLIFWAWKVTVIIRNSTIYV